MLLMVESCESVDKVDSITPDKVQGLRDLLNSSAMDIMYYTSPLYRDEVRLKHTHTHTHIGFKPSSDLTTVLALAN